MWDFVLIIATGLLAGWLAGKLMKGSGYGPVGNLVIGVLGAIIGGYIFELIGIPARGIFGTLLAAVVGAVVLLYVIQLIKKA
jgi:uncharacterized membrane protein YeaQ/YmgE (transglycosylase-associated protein family)